MDTSQRRQHPTGADHRAVSFPDPRILGVTLRSSDIPEFDHPVVMLAVLNPFAASRWRMLELVGASLVTLTSKGAGYAELSEAVPVVARELAVMACAALAKIGVESRPDLWASHMTSVAFDIADAHWPGKLTATGVGSQTSQTTSADVVSFDRFKAYRAAAARARIAAALREEPSGQIAAVL